MKKINVTGMGSVIAGGIFFGYVELSNFMDKSANLSSYSKKGNIKAHNSLFESLPEGNFDWLERVTWQPLNDGISYVIHMPLWLLLIIVGVILLVIGGIFIKK
jgi:hypothetical protein